MKMNYFMLAATAALFAACAETDLVNEIAVEETPQAIGFETFADKVTLAVTDIIVPDKNNIAKAAPALAPDDTPIISGDANGLRNTV